MGATRAMADYCDTYFYINFHACGDDQVFSLSDTLTQVLFVIRMNCLIVKAAQ